MAVITGDEKMTDTNFRPTKVGAPLLARVEPDSVGMGAGRTRGHLADHGGLRGHSVDGETYPWRVVGVGDTWEVHDVHGACHYRAPSTQGERAVYLAHARARAFKVQYPGGFIPEVPGYGPGNLGEPIGAAQRLAGLRFTLRNSVDGRVDQWRASLVQDRPGFVTVYNPRGERSLLPIHWLERCQNISLDLALDQFDRTPDPELWP